MSPLKWDKCAFWYIKVIRFSNKSDNNGETTLNNTKGFYETKLFLYFIYFPCQRKTNLLFMMTFAFNGRRYTDYTMVNFITHNNRIVTIILLKYS